MGVTLALIPGWGLDAALCRPLRALLPDSVVVNMHAPRLPDGPLVAVGHSLGFAWALRQAVPWSALVSIGGFARFTRADDFPHGIHPRLLARMRAKLAEAPAEVHGDFIRRCGGEPHDGALDVPTLDQGLGWLATWDERRALAGWRKPLLALAAADDAIVPEAMARQTFADALRLRADGGHLLPLRQPEWCVAQIRDFLAGLP